MQCHNQHSLPVMSPLLHLSNGSYQRFRLTYRRGEAGLESIQCYSSKGLKWEKGKSWNERSLKETKNCLCGAMYFLQGVFLLDNLWDGGTRYLNLYLNTGKRKKKVKSQQKEKVPFSGKTIYLLLKKKENFLYPTDNYAFSKWSFKFKCIFLLRSQHLALNGILSTW